MTPATALKSPTGRAQIQDESAFPVLESSVLAVDFNAEARLKHSAAGSRDTSSSIRCASVGRENLLNEAADRVLFDHREVDLKPPNQSQASARSVQRVPRTRRNVFDFAALQRQAKPRDGTPTQERGNRRDRYLVAEKVADVVDLVEDHGRALQRQAPAEMAKRVSGQSVADSRTSEIVQSSSQRPQEVTQSGTPGARLSASA
eukprot:3414252-Rhodomonas_salina.1